MGVEKFTRVDEQDNLEAENINQPPAETSAKPTFEAELDEDEAEFQRLRRDLPGTRGASDAGIVTISVGKKPPKDSFFRTHPDFVMTVALVQAVGGMEEHFCAVDPSMENALKSIGKDFADYRLYLTITSDGILTLVPVRCADEDGDQNDWSRSKEIGLLKARERWVRLWTKKGKSNSGYRVYDDVPPERFADPVWPDLKPAKIFRLAFRDKGWLLDSTQHLLFLKWTGRDRE
jgi:hypothetical protein